MKLDIFKIIKEEVDRWFDDEPSVLDKYYDRKFAPQPAPQPARQTASQTNDEIFGFLDKMWTKEISKPVSVYKNPKSLAGFGANCRGVLVNTGDVYIATSVLGMHWNLLELLTKKGVIPRSVLTTNYGTSLPEEYITIEREDNSNFFVQSTAYQEFPIYYQIMFDEANKKFPYKFKEVPVDASRLDVEYEY